MSAEVSFASNIFTNNSNFYDKSFLDYKIYLVLKNTLDQT